MTSQPDWADLGHAVRSLPRGEATSQGRPQEDRSSSEMSGEAPLSSGQHTGSTQQRGTWWQHGQRSLLLAGAWLVPMKKPLRSQWGVNQGPGTEVTSLGHSEFPVVH